MLWCNYLKLFGSFLVISGLTETWQHCVLSWGLSWLVSVWEDTGRWSAGLWWGSRQCLWVWSSHFSLNYWLYSRPATIQWKRFCDMVCILIGMNRLTYNETGEISFRSQRNGSTLQIVSHFGQHGLTPNSAWTNSAWTLSYCYTQNGRCYVVNKHKWSEVDFASAITVTIQEPCVLYHIALFYCATYLSILKVSTEYFLVLLQTPSSCKMLASQDSTSH